MKRTDRIMLVVTIISLIGAYFIGINRTVVDMEPFLPGFIENADGFVKEGENLYFAFTGDSTRETIGYITLAEANGYGGPMKVVAAIDPLGSVINVSIIEHRETPSWYKKVLAGHYTDKLIGKNYKEKFEIDSDIDGITGATYTTGAIVEATKKAVREIAKTQLGFEIPEEEKVGVYFGIPELTLILLFLVSWVSSTVRIKRKKVIRWVCLITGMVVLGFMFNRPLNLVNVNKFLIGFWPDWRLHFYWYFLIIGVYLVLITQKKNVYCGWFCPFGATQECLGVLGKAKFVSVGKYTELLKWLRRVVVWIAIIIAFIFRNPGISSYEVYGTLFNLTGTTLQFLLLTIVMLVSLFIYRPWCSFLCPFRSIDEFIRALRQEIVSLWRKNK